MTQKTQIIANFISFKINILQIYTTIFIRVNLRFLRHLRSFETASYGRGLIPPCTSPKIYQTDTLYH